MATAHMPDELFEAVAHHLPPEPPPGPTGGRPRVGHRAALRVIWFVPATGCRWEDVPPELGCSGRTAHRRLRAWEGCGAWDRVHADLLRLLRAAGELAPRLAAIGGVYVRAFGGGEATGPGPVGRGKPGTRHTLRVSQTGRRWPSGRPVPTPAATPNCSPLPLALRKVGGEPGRLPGEVYAGRGYDSDSARRLPAWLGVRPRIADRAEPHGGGLGTVRRVVERTVSGLEGLRRMRVRYARLKGVRGAFTTLAAAVICFRILHHDAM